MRAVILGVGNELRGDDGLGPAVVRRVARWQRPDVQCLAIRQLTPELAELLNGAGRVLLVDAAIGGESVSVTELHPEPLPGSLSHTGDLRWLLALTQALFGQCPQAWIVTIPAVNLDFGCRLSPTARRGMTQALSHIEQWLGPEPGCRSRVRQVGGKEQESCS